MPIRSWTKGDRVVHAAKPEWGLGEVLQTQATLQEGVACQQLVVRFDRAGIKTISTAFADLRPANPAFVESTPAVATLPVPESRARGPMPSEPAPEEPDGEPPLGGANPIEVMTRLPESVTDPFVPLRKRVHAAVTLYRFGETASGLLDWAAMQTGLKDPLSRFNRHQLEEYFGRFRVALDQHLRKLLRDLRKQDPGYLPEVQGTASPAGKQALRRADMVR